MERQAIPLNTIDHLLWSDTKSRPAILSPTLSHLVALCNTLHKHHSLISPLRPLPHIFHNPKFPPGLNIKAFCWWTNKGLYPIGHFLSPAGSLTLKHCRKTLEMPNSEMFHKLPTSLTQFGLTGMNHLKSPHTSIGARTPWIRGGGISLIYSSLAGKVILPAYAWA